MLHTATSGGLDGAFVPLLGENAEQGLRNCGVFGWLSLWCHGPDDLLAMTDAEYHLGAIGVGTSDVDLRQYLGVPTPSFADPRGRAELLDRMLAIDLLGRRGCKTASAELEGLAKNEGLHEGLRARAAAALAHFGGTPSPIVRRRLDPTQVALPAHFDGYLVMEHARLPDLGWLTPLGRRVGALATARAVESAGGVITADQCNKAQRHIDVVSELPFGLAHTYKREHGAPGRGVMLALCWESPVPPPAR